MTPELERAVEVIDAELRILDPELPGTLPRAWHIAKALGDAGLRIVNPKSSGPHCADPWDCCIHEPGCWDDVDQGANS